MSRENVGTMDFFTSWRERHVAAAICYPHVGRIDSAHFEYCNSWINIIQKRRLAVWRNIYLRSVWREGRPTKILTFSRGFSFPFPDMQTIWPDQWTIYRERKVRWLAGQRPDNEEVDQSTQNGPIPRVVARSATTSAKLKATTP